VKLLWTQQALEDRRSIRNWIAQHNPVAAVALDALFTEAAAHLRAHPRMGKNGRVDGTREWLAHSNYIVVYRANDQEVLILRLLHAARQWPQ